jgi:AcrR family transcriptional regulator
MSTGTSPRRGRPRDKRVDDAILTATIELIAEIGIDDLRVDEVADRAGVGKSAIYRRHDSKHALVAAAISALVSEISVPDTGSTRDDLLALMKEAVGVYNDPVRAGVMPSLVAALRHQPELAGAIREGFLTKRREALRAVLDRGVARGDLARDIDVELARDVLGGPLFYRLLITGGPLDDALVSGVAELILRGFAPTRSGKEPRR